MIKSSLVHSDFNYVIYIDIDGVRKYLSEIEWCSFYACIAFDRREFFAARWPSRDAAQKVIELLRILEPGLPELFVVEVKQ